VEPLPV